MQHSRRILIIDDDPMMAAFLEHYIGQEHDVVFRSNADDALSWINSGNTVDLIVTDLGMPGMDGQTFLIAIRSNSTFDRIPVIILSGSEKSEDRISCLRSGADDFITKPFNPEELMARIDNLFRRIS